MDIIAQHIPAEVVTTSIVGRLGIYDWLHSHPLIVPSIIILIGVAFAIKVFTHKTDKEYQTYVNGRMKKASKMR